MRIACPSCDAAYEVPDRLLAGPARRLRCSRCATDFALPSSAEAESPAPAPAAVEAEPAAPMPDPEPPLPKPMEPPASIIGPPPQATPLASPLGPSRALAPVAEAGSPALARAWVASIMVVAAALVAFFVFHDKVMEAWPASTRLFAALGLA